MRLKGMSEIQVNDAHNWVVTRHQYEISAVVLQTSYFAGKTVKSLPNGRGSWVHDVAGWKNNFA